MDIKSIIKRYNPIVKIIRFFNKKRLKNKDFTLLTMNCFGGIVYHNLSTPFLSPTVNIRFENIRHFYKFCSELPHYLNVEMTEVTSTEKYPMAKLDDLILHLVHYRTFTEAKEKWEERKKRINFNNLYIIANDYVTENEKLSKKEIIAFTQLPCKNVVVLVQDRYPDIPLTFYMGKKLSKLMNTNKITGLRGYETSFDIVKFLNSTKETYRYKQ